MMATDTLTNQKPEEENPKRQDWFFGLRMQLIIPYVGLTLLVAFTGIFILTRLVTSSTNERFNNQLNEASRVVSDVVVSIEDTHLENLRLMAFTQGIADAISSNDRQALEDILFPLVLNEQVELLSVTNLNGIELVSFVWDPVAAQYLISEGQNLGGIESIGKVQAGYSDEIGDKFSEIVETASGKYLITSAPVRDGENNLKGILVIGTSLDTCARMLKSTALADVVILNNEGLVSITTLPLTEEDTGIISLTTEELTGMGQSLRKDIEVSERVQAVNYGPLVLRQAKIGYIAVALPTNFIVSLISTSRTSLSLIFTLATVLMTVIGLGLARTIAIPILRMRDVSKKVAGGDFDQQLSLKRRDEIGELATSFNTMVSNLRSRTEELVQSEKLSAVGQLAAGLAHDVKNPLAVIKGVAEELNYEIDDGADEEFIKNYLAIIRDNADRANNILTDLMKFSRSSTFSFEPLDICDSIKQAVRLTDFLARKANVEITMDFDPPSVILEYDEQQIEQVLVNLIQNAIQAMPEGGDLKVKVETDQEDCYISVEDTGKGIPEEFLKKVFEPFFTTKPKGEGTGLGLAVAYGIIDNHKGSISVSSEVGVGTTFLIKLPLIRQ
jgi:signal transduction histidine kinase